MSIVEGDCVRVCVTGAIIAGATSGVRVELIDNDEGYGVSQRMNGFDPVGHRPIGQAARNRTP